MKVEVQLVVNGSAKQIAAVQKLLKSKAALSDEDEEDEDSGSDTEDDEDGDSSDEDEDGVSAADDDSDDEDSGDDDEEEEKPKRGRGRPPKAAAAQDGGSGLDQAKVMAAFKKFASASELNLKKVKGVLKKLGVKSVRDLPDNKLKAAMAALKAAQGK